MATSLSHIRMTHLMIWSVVMNLMFSVEGSFNGSMKSLIELEPKSLSTDTTSSIDDFTDEETEEISPRDFKVYVKEDEIFWRSNSSDVTDGANQNFGSSGISVKNIPTLMLFSNYSGNVTNVYYKENKIRFETTENKFSFSTSRPESVRKFEIQTEKYNRNHPAKDYPESLARDVIVAEKDTTATYCRMGTDIRSNLPTERGYFNNLTCYFCYSFIPVHRKKYSLDIQKSIFVESETNTAYDYYYFNENGTAYNFSPDDNNSWNRISSSMQNNIEAGKLKFCCKQAETCCQEIIETNKPGSGGDVLPASGGSCPPTWDGWSCIHETVAEGEVASVPCPVFAYEGFPTCRKNAVKRCLSNGTWELKDGYEWTDYTLCSLRTFEHTLYGWEIATHAVSIIFLVPAIILLLSFRKLRLQRFYMHLNFFIALLGKSFFKILEITLLKMPEMTNANDVLGENPAGCKLLVFLSKYFLVSSWSWMLAESYYLHHLIARAFRKPATIKVFLAVGWVTPMVMTSIWAVTRASLEDSHCWLGAAKSEGLRLHLITEVFQLLSLLMNVALLMDMARVLGTKLRGVNTNNSEATKKAVRATVFLVPMFGLQFLFTLIAPKRGHTSCLGMEIYLIFAFAVSGLQGVYVSIIYCYMNAEVRMTVSRSLMMKYPSLFKTSQVTSTFEPMTTYSQVQSEGYSVTYVAENESTTKDYKM